MIYIMRHGKTDWNAEYRLQGRTDIPLNEEGRQMARDAAKKYKDVQFDVCYVSPLLRAKETADIFLQGRDVPIVTDDRLMEMSFGEYEGLDHLYDKPEHPARVMFCDPVNYVAPDNGESFEELFARTGSFLEECAIPDHESGKSVLIIGHGAMNLSILNRIQNRPLKDFWEPSINNCELTKVL